MNEATQIIADQVAEEMLRLKRLESGKDAVAYLEKLIGESLALASIRRILGEKCGKAELPE